MDVNIDLISTPALIDILKIDEDPYTCLITHLGYSQYGQCGRTGARIKNR
jgi:hypothetical protein